MNLIVIMETERVLASRQDTALLVNLHAYPDSFLDGSFANARGLFAEDLPLNMVRCSEMRRVKASHLSFRRVLSEVGQ